MKFHSHPLYCSEGRNLKTWMDKPKTINKPLWRYSVGENMVVCNLGSKTLQQQWIYGIYMQM